jgi:hypothetical protein
MTVAGISEGIGETRKFKRRLERKKRTASRRTGRDDASPRQPGA